MKVYLTLSGNMLSDHQSRVLSAGGVISATYTLTFQPEAVDKPGDIDKFLKFHKNLLAAGDLKAASFRVRAMPLH